MIKSNGLSLLSAVLGEFFIILDAGFVGAIMSSGNVASVLERCVFWIFLFLGIGLRYLAEKFKK